jgi:CRP/FNR family transcriptional regulator
MKPYRPCGPDIGCPRGVRSAAGLAALSALKSCRPQASAEATASCMGRLPLLQGLSHANLLALARASRIRRVARGAPLVTGGQYLGIVVSGLLQVSVADADRRQAVYLVSPGQVCGDQEMLRTPSQDCVTEAVDRTDLLLIQAEAFLAVAVRVPLLMRRLTRILSARILHVTETIELMTRRSASERVAAFLLCLSRCDAVAHRMGYVSLPVRKRTAASLLDLSGESFSRTLRRFKDEGVIESSGQTIRVLDRPALERLAGPVYQF